MINHGPETATGKAQANNIIDFSSGQKIAAPCSGFEQSLKVGGFDRIHISGPLCFASVKPVAAVRPYG